MSCAQAYHQVKEDFPDPNSKDTVGQSVSVTAAQQRYLDLLAEQRGVYAMANTTYCTQINTSWELGTQLGKTTKQAIWLEVVVPSTGAFFDLFNSDRFCFGDYGSEVHSKHWELPCL